MNEKIYNGLGLLGVTGIVVGIIVTVIGIVGGVLSILCGAKALSMKKKIMI